LLDLLSSLRFDKPPQKLLTVFLPLTTLPCAELLSRRPFHMGQTIPPTRNSRISVRFPSADSFRLRRKKAVTLIFFPPPHKVGLPSLHLLLVEPPLSPPSTWYILKKWLALTLSPSEQDSSPYVRFIPLPSAGLNPPSGEGEASFLLGLQPGFFLPRPRARCFQPHEERGSPFFPTSPPFRPLF